MHNNRELVTIDCLYHAQTNCKCRVFLPKEQLSWLIIIGQTVCLLYIRWSTWLCMKSAVMLIIYCKQSGSSQRLLHECRCVCKWNFVLQCGIQIKQQYIALLTKYSLAACQLHVISPTHHTSYWTVSQWRQQRITLPLWSSLPRKYSLMNTSAGNNHDNERTKSWASIGLRFQILTQTLHTYIVT